jgi:hypothetical protein
MPAASANATVRTPKRSTASRALLAYSASS